MSVPFSCIVDNVANYNRSVDLPECDILFVCHLYSSEDAVYDHQEGSIDDCTMSAVCNWWNGVDLSAYSEGVGGKDILTSTASATSVYQIAFQHVIGDVSTYVSHSMSRLGAQRPEIIKPTST